MNAVAQEHALGCAVACVAARNGTSYQEALRLFADPAAAWLRGYWCAEVIAALERCGRSYQCLSFDRGEHLAWLAVPGTIAFIDRCEAYPLGHYLVRGNEGWMNPWINFPWMLRVRAGFEAELPGVPGYLLVEPGRSGVSQSRTE